MAAAQRAVQEAQGLCRRIEELQDTHKGIGAKVLIVQRNIEKVKANISRLGAQKQEEQDQVMRLFKRRAENEIRDLEYRERESVRQNYNSSRRAKLRTFKREVHTAKSKLTEACNNRINALALLQAQIDAFGDSSEVYEEREQKKLERERQLMSFDKRNKSLEEEEKQLVQKLSQAKVKNDSARYEMSVEEEEQASLRSKSLGYSVDQVTELSEKKRNTTAVVVDLHSKLQVLKGKISFMQRQERKRKQASLSWQFTRDNKTKRELANSTTDKKPVSRAPDTASCNYCSRTFKNRIGLSHHLKRWCKLNPNRGTSKFDTYRAELEAMEDTFSSAQKSKP